MPKPNSAANKLSESDRPIHDWYRFVLSFPPHLARDYVERFSLCPDQVILDPFCGTGTTLVECKKLGFSSIGIEGNSVVHFASQVKTDWTPDASGLWNHAQKIADKAQRRLAADGIEDKICLPEGTIDAKRLKTLPEEAFNLLLDNSISPLPLHKTLVLLECLNEEICLYSRHERLALAKVAVASISNLRFGPEIGVTKPKPDAPVLSVWLDAVRAMAEDLRNFSDTPAVSAQAYHADARHIMETLEPASIDAVITSPPYPNEKDYTRATRLESVLLGFLKNKRDLRGLKQFLIRSNTRNVYKWDYDDRWLNSSSEALEIADAIEARRIALNKTSGFERLYATVTRLYFGGMTRHLSDLRAALRPGAKLAYVVGDQASYLRVMVRTGEMIACIAEQLGYKVIGIDLFRTRLATATGEQLREEVLVLEWPCKADIRRRSGVPDEETETESSGDETNKNRYVQLIEAIFKARYQAGATAVDFKRVDIEDTAVQLKVKLPKKPWRCYLQFSLSQ